MAGWLKAFRKAFDASHAIIHFPQSSFMLAVKHSG